MIGEDIMKTKIVRNYSDANELMHKGYRCLGVDRDNRNRKFIIFFFEESEELIKDLKELEVTHKVYK